MTVTNKLLIKKMKLQIVSKKLGNMVGTVWTDFEHTRIFAHFRTYEYTTIYLQPTLYIIKIMYDFIKLFVCIAQ